MRQAAKALGLDQANQLIAVTDAGQGIEACLRRHFWDDLLCVLDWYHACEHLQAYSKWLEPRDEAARRSWVKQAESILYEQGGTGLLAHLRQQAAPADEAVGDEGRKVINYFADNEHRTDYPTYKKQGWDIGAGPVGACFQVIDDPVPPTALRSV